MATQATLINKQGQKQVVEGGSQQAQELFGQGYQLMGPSGQYVEPETTPVNDTSPVTGNVSGTDVFLPTPAPTQEEATADALGSTQYKEGAGFISEQESLDRAGLEAQKETTTRSYARTREDTIRAFQDALDEINSQAREVGIKTRDASARRGLYDPSGELSGIGQGVAARAIEPLNRQTRKLAERQGVALSRLTEDEASTLANIDRGINALGLRSRKEKANLKNQIVKGIFDAAKERQEQELEIFKENRTLQNQLRDDIRESEKLLADTPGTRQNQLRIREEQQARGRFYIGDPATRDQLISQGFDLFQIGDDVFALSAKEQADLDAKRRVKLGDSADIEKQNFAINLQNARLAIEQGADPNTVRAFLLSEHPTRTTAIKAGLEGAGFRLESDPFGGVQAFGPGGIPITPEQFGAGTDTPLSEIFGRSSLEADQQRALQELDRENKVDVFDKLIEDAFANIANIQ